MKKLIILILVLFLFSSFVSAVDAECRDIEDARERSDCYYDLARTVASFEDCAELQHFHARGACYERFIDKADDCSRIGDWDSVNRDYCYLRFAFEYNEPVVYPENCAKIQTTALKGQCYYRVAQHGHEYNMPDTSKYCDMITYGQETECFDEVPDSTQRMCANLKKIKDDCYELSGEHAKYVTHSGLAGKLVIAAVIVLVALAGILLIAKLDFLSNFIFGAVGVAIGSFFFIVFTMVYTRIWTFALFLSSAFLYIPLILQNLFGAREGYPLSKFTYPTLTAFLLIAFWVLFILLLKYFIKNWQIRKFKVFTILLIIAVAALNLFFTFIAYLSAVG